ncbi:nuclear condensing complex subunit [Mycena belliarum]|uniref:Nuclear condensing complex subunit n=1 Tax=Mycena belliarum TaxID=1033014 RepID=A0AAD6U3X8_9AGAR|nr:nuclear condensing complex subunit [Mycena belliae]
MPARTLPALNLQTAVPHIFEQVQATTANHQKNLVALHKLHLEAARKTEQVGNGHKLVGEREFEGVFMGMLARVLPVKKGATTADRVVKFIGSYIRFINERAAYDREDEENDSDDEDTTASRFTAKLLKVLLKGFQAKDKVVRYRVISIAAEMVAHLGEVDEDIYKDLRAALLDRIHDKESMIRVQVVLALSKLAGSEDPSELGEGESTVLQVLIDTLSTDDIAEVRRATMLNIPVSATSLTALLLRSRDTETTIRKLLYSSVLDGAAQTSAHPKTLTVAQREIIVRNGLGDREPTVRAAAATLLGTWIDLLGDPKTEEELASRLASVDLSKTEEQTPLTLAEKQQKIVDTLTVFLKMFDLCEVSVVEGETLDGKIAADALKSVFETRPDIFEDLYFGSDAFFADPTAEKMFLARVFVDYCSEDKGRGEQKMEDAGIPVVTSCAFRIQNGYNALVVADEEKQAAKQNGDDDEEKEDARVEKESIVGELLKLVLHLDYGDEVGKRKMFALVRDMLTRPTLPLKLVPRCLDVLRKVSHNNERDLIRVVVEIIQDLRVPGDEEDDADAANQSQDTITLDGDADTSFDSETPVVPKKPVRTREEMSPDERRNVDMIDMRCLTLCIGMLERVDSTLDENSTLHGLLGDLIIPSIKRNEDEFREKGYTALGMFCLISKSLAVQTLSMFVAQAEPPQVPEALRLTLVQIIVDLLMTHERMFLRPGGDNAEKMINFLLTHLTTESNRADASPKVLALLSTAIAKLLMLNLITDEKAVRSLLTVYFSPYNADNQQLKQCLAYFAPAYSHSSAQNQRVMRKIFIRTFEELSTLREELNEEEKEGLNLGQITDMWLYWTNPLEVHDPYGRPGDAGKAGDPLVQFEMANDIIRALLKKKEIPKDDTKVLVQMLGKLHIPDDVDVDKIRTLKLLIHTLNLRRPLKDTATKNAFKKFDATISKKFEKQLEDFDEEEYRKLEELKELFEFLDDIMPEDDDEVINVDAKKKGKKRRSDSIMSTTTDGDDASAVSSRRRPSKPKTKRRRLSTSDDEESDFEEADDRTPKGTPPPPTRTLPRRSAAVRKPEVITIRSDDEDSDSDQDEATPAAQKGRSRVVSRTRKVKEEEEAELDADIDDLLGDDEEASMEIPHDSIMDDSDEEDEVNDLLAAD